MMMMENTVTEQQRHGRNKLHYNLPKDTLHTTEEYTVTTKGLEDFIQLIL